MTFLVRRHHPTARRRGMLIVVVLAIITVLALLGASFSYWMNADLATTKAAFDMQQAELAAESGVGRIMLQLRKDPTNIEQDPVNMDKWYNNPLAFRRSSSGPRRKSAARKAWPIRRRSRASKPGGSASWLMR